MSQDAFESPPSCHRQFGLEHGGQLGGFLGVHDDLHVARGLYVQAVGGQQGQGDVAQPFGDLAEFEG